MGSKDHKLISDPFESSDEEEYDNDNILLTHLVKEVSDIGLEDMDLGTKICDLMVTSRKSKATTGKRKGRKKNKQNKKVSQ